MKYLRNSQSSLMKNELNQQSSLIKIQMKYSFNEQSSFMKIQLFSFKSAAKYNENSDDNSDNIIIKSVVESNEHSIGDFFW